MGKSLLLLYVGTLNRSWSGYVTNLPYVGHGQSNAHTASLRCETQVVPTGLPPPPPPPPLPPSMAICGGYTPKICIMSPSLVLAIGESLRS